ncbi:hypothetical protein [Phenylobacterium sp.]|uniref:hypothetical protein n=1 Tax=Phenylobacterium sp. TaxID=1871053 RepID=UPI00356862BD
MDSQAIGQELAEAPSAGVEQLAAAALKSLWRTAGRLGPLWLIGTLFIALKIVATNGLLAGASEVQAGMTTGALELAGHVLPAAVSGLAIRMYLGRGRDAWKLDGAFWRYVGVITLLSLAPVMLSVWVNTLWTGGLPKLDMGLLAEATIAAAVLILLVWSTLRLLLWPVGRLMGEADMTPDRSWSLMRGGVVGFFGASTLLTAPLFMLSMIPAMLTLHGDHAQGELLGAPLGSAMTLVFAAVAAEIYRLRLADLAGRPRPVAEVPPGQQRLTASTS